MIFVITAPGSGMLSRTPARVKVGLLAYAGAAILSGIIVGTASGALGAVLVGLAPGLRLFGWAAIAAVALTYGLAELFGVRLRVPTRHWLVPKEWALLGPVPFAAIFGFMLGAGFFTVINFVGYHLLVSSCILLANPLSGALLGGVFGLGRAAYVVLTPFVSWLQRTPYTLDMASVANSWYRDFDRQVTRWLRPLGLLLVFGLAISYVI